MSQNESDSNGKNTKKFLERDKISVDQREFWGGFINTQANFKQTSNLIDISLTFDKYLYQIGDQINGTCTINFKCPCKISSLRLDFTGREDVVFFEEKSETRYRGATNTQTGQQLIEASDAYEELVWKKRHGSYTWATENLGTY